MSEKVVTIEIYERDLKSLDYAIPTKDPPKEKFRAILALVQDFEDVLSTKT